MVGQRRRIYRPKRRSQSGFGSGRKKMIYDKIYQKGYGLIKKRRKQKGYGVVHKRMKKQAGF